MPLEFRKTVRTDYSDVLTDDAVRVMEALARFDVARKQVMASRIARRADRAGKRERIGFLDPGVIARTSSRSGRARAISWARRFRAICGVDQGTGPAARPGASVEIGLRNIAYALLAAPMAGCSTARRARAVSTIRSTTSNLTLANSR